MDTLCSVCNPSAGTDYVCDSCYSSFSSRQSGYAARGSSNRGVDDLLTRLGGLSVSNNDYYPSRGYSSYQQPSSSRSRSGGSGLFPRLGGYSSTTREPSSGNSLFGTLRRGSRNHYTNDAPDHGDLLGRLRSSLNNRRYSNTGRDTYRRQPTFNDYDRYGYYGSSGRDTGYSSLGQSSSYGRGSASRNNYSRGYYDDDFDYGADFPNSSYNTYGGSEGRGHGRNHSQGDAYIGSYYSYDYGGRNGRSTGSGNGGGNLGWY